MGDKNLIQIKRGQPWHYWNFGNMMPICGAGEPDLMEPKHPKEFRRSMHRGFEKVKKVCERCEALEQTQASQQLDDSFMQKIDRLSKDFHPKTCMAAFRSIYEEGITEGLKRAKEQ